MVPILLILLDEYAWLIIRHIWDYGLLFYQLAKVRDDFTNHETRNSKSLVSCAGPEDDYIQNGSLDSHITSP